MYKHLMSISALLLTTIAAQAATLNIHSNNTSNQAVYVKISDKTNYPLAYDTTAANTKGVTSADANLADYFEISFPSETNPGECKINIIQDKSTQPEQLFAKMMYNDPPVLCMLPNGVSKVALTRNQKGDYDLDVLVKISS